MMPLHDKSIPILVTGGAGYIGSHTCKALSEQGFLPICLDNLVYGNRWAVQWGPFEEGDMGDVSRVTEILHAYQPKAIIHFASYAYVGESVSNPSKYYRNNVVSTINLLEAILAWRPIPFVFSSSCAIYGIPHEIPLSESHSKEPISPYGNSKWMVERILQDYGNAYQLPYVALRYFNASGADASSKIGESHNPETHLIPLAIEVALGIRPELHIFGTDYPTPDGTAVRDYIHVTDLADAHVKAVNYLLKGGSNMALNVGVGRGYSVKEIIGMIEQKTRVSLKAIQSDRRPGDPPILIADSQLIKKTLHWHPHHSSLETIIQTAISWHQSQSNVPIPSL